MRLLVTGFSMMVAFILGVLFTDWTDARRERQFMAQLQEWCVPQPGERTVAVNDDGKVQCDRQTMIKHPALRWPWPR